AAAASAPEPAAVGAAAASTPAAPAATPAAAPAAGGRRAASRAGVGAGDAAPERMQRLLAVVKPESIQRVEKEPIDRVNTWPHLMAAEFLAVLAVTALLTIVSVFVNAELRELANINVTPNPSKAPWYFLGLQELLRYFHPQVAGVSIPQWLILGLMATPYIDRNPSNKPGDRKLAISMWTIFMLMFAILGMLGSIMRGPGFNFVYPWDAGIFFEL
ncbi:MAG: menaquinol-cytochrome c reductase cytochrome b subunit, partial [Actinomycetota bacterium]